MSNTASIARPAGIAVADVLGAAGRSIGYLLVALGHLPRAHRVIAEYAALSRLDDAALDERGLARDEIARHVLLRRFPDI